MNSPLSRVPGRDNADVAFYEGYQRGHNDTAKMLSRRSLAYLFVGGFFGAALVFLAAQSGALADFSRAERILEDPALKTERPKEYVRAIDWAKRFTVGIIAEQPGRRRQDMFGRIYELPGSQHIGSGIILNEQGYVLTNSHVIPDSATRLEVVLGEKAYEARFVGRRADYDIAIIKINARGLTPASLGDSDKVEQGDVVIAIGSPYGLFHTATEGIVSFVGREGGMGSLVPNYLQTSAAINGGNSGGPLIDLTGRVVGINTWKLSGSGNEGIDGIGFAIPINVARRVSERILGSDDQREDTKISDQPRDMRSAYLGIQAETGLRTEQPSDGVIIKEVVAGSAADIAGLRPGDKITHVNQTGVKSFQELAQLLAALPPGAEIDIRYVRDGLVAGVKVKLGGRNR
ncbi:MAG TPA: trypsin-like peptidase domain-containing protein [Planctomycetota bacterium]|nr:trypsin-like peptidase domain-containing protein [Planctomycetota bacterium]